MVKMRLKNKKQSKKSKKKMSKKKRLQQCSDSKYNASKQDKKSNDLYDSLFSFGLNNWAKPPKK